ncbi:hypothetical protein [Clostridium pasteurianum]|uniref:Uncharacterized protein n=1 Tax=Clostridium pasteurianum BC1 TaxID=86416 RepID=R4K3Z9_CLOPA|nr:hypothetical protein [Clostridium pasteurianum]AGK97862.1 hypothetical protein Clopa_3034 [Clostridium pasteurianum BC1]
MKGFNKKLILIVTFIIALMATILIGYNSDKKKQLKVINLGKDTKIVENEKEILYNIDSINLSNGLGNITGWAIINGMNSYNIMPTLILKSEDGDLYKVKTRIVKRRDITKIFNGEFTDDNTHLTCVTPSGLGVTKNKNVYDNSGIISEFNIDNLRKNQSYKIGIQLQVNKANYFVWTNKKMSL